ncbi:nuclear body protein SP140-like protein isoform X2 [Eleginops maclovinus]
MDVLFWLDDEALLQFFHRHKTEMSCMEDPHIFLNQLRDHDLVLEDTYKVVSHMRSKNNIQKGLYKILDYLERKQRQDIRTFWSCVFTETMLNKYPNLRLLRNRLKDGPFEFEVQGSENSKTEEADKGKRKNVSEDEEEEGKQKSSVKKKRKLRNRDEEEDQPGPSSRVTPRKSSKKLHFSSPLKKGEKNDIWTWALYKSQLPVTCGGKEGILSRRRLANGEKCIVVGREWFSPSEFEKFAGRERSRNWKSSIRCRDTTLGKLIQAGHLEAAKYKGGCKKKCLFPSEDENTVSEEQEDDEDEDSDEESSRDITAEEGETEEEIEEETEASTDSSRKVFKVTCGPLVGTLHERRFASGILGKSIRTDTGWMTPKTFMLEACPTYLYWKKEIKCEGKPLCDLIMAKLLLIHAVRCDCRLCKPGSEDLDDEKNDDECFICKTKEGEEGEFMDLVECDFCPRSFHKKCHLPHIEDNIIGDRNEWMCTFCVYKANKRLFNRRMERQAALSRQISQRLLHCQYLLLCLRGADEDHIFAYNPRDSLDRFLSLISKPMSNVSDKLQKKLYQTVGDFVTDVQLIFSNCASYYQGNAGYLASGNRLEELFNEEFNSVFNITEQAVG